MLNSEKRVTMLRKRAATRREKVANLPTVRKLTLAAEADEALASKLEIEHAKRKADRSRKDTKHAKIVIGAGVMLLPTNTRASILAVVLSSLIERDQNWLKEWFANEKVDFLDSVIADNSDVALPLVDSTSAAEQANRAVGEALKRTFEGMKEGELGLITPDVLGYANAEDRAVLDAWLAKHGSSNT